MPERSAIAQRDSAPEIPLAAAPMAPSGSPKLDVLRSVAILTVVFSHVWFENISIAWLGRVGVLFFFVHTSLVLMFSLERQFASAGSRILFTAFMIRRILRIYPLSMVVVTVLFVFDIPGRVFLDNRVHAVPIDGTAFVMHLLLVQDMVISQDRPGPMLGVLWTLTIELRMYLVLPVIYLAVRRFGGFRPLLVLAVLSAWLALEIETGNLIERLFGTSIVELQSVAIRFPRILEFVPHFLAGVLAYALWRRGSPRLPFPTLPVLLGLILLLYFMLLERDGRPDVRVHLVGILGCFAIGALLPWIREPAWRPIRWACKEIARYSYAIYLVHVPCMWFAFERLDGVSNAVQWLAFIGLTGGISILLYVTIERPFIRLGSSLGQRWVKGERGDRRFHRG